jgi:hypothetical protein
MQADDISKVISSVLKKLKDHGQKEGLVCYDFTGSHPLVIGLVQKMLIDRGFGALIALTDDEEQTTRMYIDASKRRVKETKHDAK